MNELPRRNDVPPEVCALVEAYCAGTLTDDERVQLEAQLRDNESCQAYFLAFMAVHSGLYWSLRDQSPALPGRTPAAPAAPLVAGANAESIFDKLADTTQSQGHPLLGSVSSPGWLTLGAVFLAAVVLTSAVAFFAGRQSSGDRQSSVAAAGEKPASDKVVRGSLAATDHAHPVARLDKLESQVLVERGGAKKQAVAGMDLLADDSLDVPGGGSAELTFVGQARAKLGPRTTFVLGSGREGILREGFVQIDARGQQMDEPLAIETPDAQARIQDAWFAMGADRKRTQIRVAEGRVFASRRTDGVEVEISQGYCSTFARSVDPDPRPSGNGTALFVVSSKAIYAHEDWERFDQILADRIMGDRLWRSATSVRVRTYDELRAEDFAGCSLVVLSVFPFQVGIEEKLRKLKVPELSVPVVCLEPAAFPALGLTGPKRDADFGFARGPLVADVAAPSHPLSSGFVGSGLNLFASRKSPYAWGKPTSAAHKILQIHKHPDRWLLFAYDRGDAMVKGIAPARRVGLFMDPIGADYESPTLDLVDAAIDWCLESIARDAAPAANSSAGTGDAVDVLLKNATL
jgi:hypothetical protein